FRNNAQDVRDDRRSRPCPGRRGSLQRARRRRRASRARARRRGGRNEQLTIDRAELERTLMMKSGERGKSIADLRQRLTALEGEKVREVSSTYALSSFRELVPLRMA